MKPALFITLVILLMVISPAPAVPGPPECDWCDEAEALYKQGDCKGALGVLKKGLKTDQEFSEAYALRAACQATLDRPRQAAAALVEFFRLEPTREQIARVEQVIKDEMAQPMPDALSLELEPGVIGPVLLLQSRPSYPDMAVEAGIQGASVVFDATIGSDGVPFGVTIRESENSNEHEDLGFDEATINAVKNWRFFPGLLEGMPVEVKLTGIVKFNV